MSQFNFKRNNVIKWPVIFAVPADGGSLQELVITAHFKLVTKVQFTELAAKGDADLLKAVFVGWDGIGDENGDALPFAEADRDELIGYPFIESALTSAYVKAYLGGAAKN